MIICFLQVFGFKTIYLSVFTIKTWTTNPDRASVQLSILGIEFVSYKAICVFQVGTKQFYWLVQNKPSQITENGSLQKWRLPRILGLDILNIIC